MMVTESSTMSASAHSEDRKENSFLNRARPITITSTSQPMVTSTVKYVMLVLVSGHFNSVPVNCASDGLRISWGLLQCCMTGQQRVET